MQIARGTNQACAETNVKCLFERCSWRTKLQQYLQVPMRCRLSNSCGSIRIQFYNFLFSSNPYVQKRSKCGNIFIISSLIENVRNIVEQFFEIWQLFSKIKPGRISFLNQRISTSLEMLPKLLRRQFARPISHSALFPKTPWHGAKMGRRLVIVS